MHIRYVTSPPNPRNIINAKVPYKIIASKPLIIQQVVQRKRKYGKSNLKFHLWKKIFLKNMKWNTGGEQ